MNEIPNLGERDLHAVHFAKDLDLASSQASDECFQVHEFLLTVIWREADHLVGGCRGQHGIHHVKWV